MVASTVNWENIGSTNNGIKPCSLCKVCDRSHRDNKIQIKVLENSN